MPQHGQYNKCSSREPGTCESGEITSLEPTSESLNSTKILCTVTCCVLDDAAQYCNLGRNRGVETYILLYTV